MGEFEVYRAAGEHDECQCCVAGVESVGASDDEADFGVESLVAGVADAVLDGVEDHVAALTHSAGAFDEGCESRTCARQVFGLS